MGGEGAMMAMAASLKNNNNLKSKRKDRPGLSGSYSNVQMQEFPKATPEMLEHIKTKTIKENKKTRLKQLVCFFVVVIVIFVTFILI